jgi:uncharacterized protein with NAD-binding domain and iron-sulfur cluster
MTEVAVVGGGLAGMTAALRLLERGCRVTIFEATERLGGKAGANKDHHDYNDHGYHMFPLWYLNVWKLVEELGIGDHFVDCTDFLLLEAGQLPHFKSLRNMASVKYLPHNLTSGIFPLPEMFLFFYSILDLITQRYHERSLLDQISATGFIRSRFYRTERIAQQYQDMMLKGISVPSYFVSAMTMRQVMRYWFRYPIPMFRAPKGNLQQMWIKPIEDRLRKLGCRIEFHHHLERIEISERVVSGLEFRRNKDTKATVPVEKVIIAVPFERLAMLLDDQLYVSAPDLFRIKGLNSRPMAALNLYMKRRIPGIPPHHTDLVGSRFSLSFIDVSQIWPGCESTVLNLIASDFTALQSLSEHEAVSQLLADMQPFLPQITTDDIDRLYFQSHVRQPLFMNDVAAWQFRLNAHTQLKNLYVAGDYCRSHVDLVSMEGAVTTGLLAAEALRKDAGINPPVEILVPKEYPEMPMILAKIALLPLVAVAKLVTLFAGN